VTSFYGFRCAVAFRAAGEARRSQLDFGSAFNSKIDAEIWAARFPPGGQISILYKPTDATRVRFSGDAPTVVTASGTVKVAGCLLFAGLLAILVSKQELLPHR
jgi:hypothetical protein